MATSPAARVRSFKRSAAVSLATGDLEFIVVPEAGLLGASLEWQGLPFLDLHGGVDAYRRGHTTGLPLLHPWANRLGGRSYVADGLDVDLSGLDLHTDENGLPMHGTMAGRSDWDVEWLGAGLAAATLRARYDFSAHPDQLASFPFPHELVVEFTNDGALTVTTTLRPTGSRRVPVSFGWHPYFRLPGARRSAIALSLPRRQHVTLDERGLPTGGSELEAAATSRLGADSYDDQYVLGSERRVAIEGAGHRVQVSFDEGFPFAQVYAPPARNVVCLEPMTALTNALAKGECPLVTPGDSFSASFTVSVDSL
jgi:aldose 1-epimerase